MWLGIFVGCCFLAHLKLCSANGCNESDPFQNIFPADYKKSEAPVKITEPVSIYVGIQVFDIYDLNEETMDYYIHMYFDDVWKDYRLTPKCLNRNRPIIFPEEIAEKLWTPDIYFENSKWGELFRISVPNINVKIYPDGTLYRSARYVLRLSCPMNLRYYPMDIQVCPFKIGLFAHPNSLAELHWSEEEGCPKDGMLSVDLLSPTMLPQFDLVNVSTGKFHGIWSTGNYTSLVANFTFERHLTSHIVNTYIPSSLVVALSWLSFWLEVGAVPARVTLGVTSLLTLSTQVVQSRSNLPPVAYINALDIWLFMCVNMVFGAIVEYGLSYYLEGHDLSRPKQFLQHSKLALKKWLKTAQMPVAPLKIEPKEQSEADRIQTNSCKSPNSSTSSLAPNKPQQTKQKTQPIDKVSRVLFPLLFVCFNCIYWPFYLTADRQSRNA